MYMNQTVPRLLVLQISRSSNELEHIPHAHVASASAYIDTCTEMKAALAAARMRLYSRQPYLRILLGCVHEQKVHGLQLVESMGVANKTQRL